MPAASEPAGNNRNDRTHERKHAGDLVAVNLKTLDFSPLSEFLAGITAADTRQIWGNQSGDMVPGPIAARLGGDGAREGGGGVRAEASAFRTSLRHPDRSEGTRCRA